ncbi:MAG: hypothetical protein O7198_02290 [Wolbachia endosymbiont of Nomada marshamella]|nr:hypothetical protein [Wolbachia endosymbiont of Nomada marshamella]
MKWLDPSVTHWDDKKGHWDDKRGRWDDKRGYWDDKKRRLLGWQERSSRMTPHHVIPALDAGIQPFHNHQNVVF